MPDPIIPPKLVEHINRHDCILFVGDALEEAGSLSSRLASALMDDGRIHAGCPIPACKSGSKCALSATCVVPLTRAAQLYESRHSRHALVDFVKRQVGDIRPPDPIHLALVALPVKVIITTAYDDRLETALRQTNRQFLSVVSDTDVPFNDHSRVQLIRLHGTVSQPDSLILTEDDTADLFARLPIVTKVLQAHFASKTLLFVGYGLNDPYFLTLYRQVIGPIARHQRPAYAVQWPTDPLDVDRWRRHEITLIDAKPLRFLITLSQSVRQQAAEVKRAILPQKPYKFLDFFTSEDNAIFFGRDLEADLLLSTILAHKLTVFYGRSGTGKTSLLLARVGPALESIGYRLVYTRMLGDPEAEVKAAVRRVKAEQLSYADRGRRLVEVLKDSLPPAGLLVIILDQFEEFFLRQGEAVREAFTKELADCLWPEPNEITLDLHVVLSLRDDYLGTLDELNKVFPEDVFVHRYKLENLSREKALLAIFKPAEAFGLSIEESLRERITVDLEDQGLEATNLQIVLYNLYEDAIQQGLWFEVEKKGTGLTLARYLSLGGTRGILAGYLDEVLNKLPEVHRNQARTILKSMVTARQTKLAVSGQEIARSALVAKMGLSAEIVDILLAYLREERVIRKFGDEDQYELAHEVLVEKVWAWLDDEELWLLDVRDMLRREMSNYRSFGHLLTKEKLELLDSCREALNLNSEELELIFRSAFTTRHETSYWFERALEMNVALVNIWQSDMQIIPSEALVLIHNYRKELNELTKSELEFLLRSAFAIGYEVVYWFERAREGGMQVSDIIGPQIPPKAFQLLHDHHKELKPLTKSELELFLRSAISAKHEVGYWFEKANEGNVTAEYIALEALKDSHFHTRAAAITTLGKSQTQFIESIIDMLADYYPQVRMAALTVLEKLQPEGAWRERLEFECYIPAGPFLMGDNQGREDEKPVHEIYLDSFYIGKYPVTNIEYERYMAVIGRDFHIPAGKANHPVVGISWYDACNYADWAGMRLVTEAEWEKAASWKAGHRNEELEEKKRRYPWGDDYSSDRCNTEESRIGTTSPVGKYSPTGDSSFGVTDMIGNVCEWCSSVYKNYPYKTDDDREDLTSSSPRVLRGGSFSSGAINSRCSTRNQCGPHLCFNFFGFRLGWSPCINEQVQNNS